MSLETLLHALCWAGTYGPVAPGRETLSIFVLLFFERQGWCGLGNEGIKVSSSVTFPKCTGNLIIEENLRDFLLD